MRATARTGIIAAVALMLLGGATMPSAASAQLFEPPRGAGIIEGLLRAHRVDEALQRLNALISGDADDVEEAARIVSYLARQFGSDLSREDFDLLADSIRSRLPDLPREQAARTARWVLRLGSRTGESAPRDIDELTRDFIEEYTGTEAALSAEIGLIVSDSWREPDRQIAELDAFARDHAGTAVGAEAVYRKGYALVGSSNIEPRSADPTERFMRVLAVVDELESGRWPPCEWVDRAPELITAFHSGLEPDYAPGNVERMLEAHTTFVTTRFALDSLGWVSNLIRFVILDDISALHEERGDLLGGMEDTFDELEREVGSVAALRFLKAEFYIQEAFGFEPRDRPTLVNRAAATLAALTESGDEPYAPRALAKLGDLHFYERDFDQAAAAYDRQLAEWPDVYWTPESALRLGQVREALGDWEGAASSYADVARNHPTTEAGIFASALAGRANESLGRPNEALEHYVEAESNWSASRYSLLSSLDSRYRLSSRARTFRITEDVRRADLSARIAELTALLSFPEGALVELGRRLLEQERWLEARAALEAVINDHPTSPLLQEARYLMHRARFEQAFRIAQVESEAPDLVNALAELGALASEPWDPAIGAAQLAYAALLGTGGHYEQARALTDETLQEWSEKQGAYYDRGPSDPLQADVTAIRNLVFRPLGGGFYDHERLSDAGNWPSRLPPFVLLEPDLPVTLQTRQETRVRVTATPPGFENILFLSQEHRGLLYTILDRLWGTQTGTPRSDSEPPSQPPSKPVDIVALWSEFLSSRPGHWSDWINLRTYPVIRGIEFHNEERTRAAVYLGLTFANCRVILEKQGDKWVFLRLAEIWSV